MMIGSQCVLWKDGEDLEGGNKEKTDCLGM